MTLAWVAIGRNGANADMAVRIRSPRDLGAGVLFALIGVAGFWFGRVYTFGSISRMGPGYFPTVLSVLLMLFGALIAGRALVFDGPPIERGSLRSSGLIVACILAFGALIAGAGLAPTVLVVTLLGSFAIKEAKGGEALMLAVGMVVFCVAIFIYGLQLRLPLFFDAWLR